MKSEEENKKMQEMRNLLENFEKIKGKPQGGD